MIIKYPKWLYYLFFVKLLYNTILINPPIFFDEDVMTKYGRYHMSIGKLFIKFVAIAGVALFSAGSL